MNINNDFKDKNHPFRYTDLFLIPILILLIVLTIVFINKPKGSRVVISSHGKVIGEYNLTGNRVISVGETIIDGDKKPLLKVIIKDGTVKVVESTCPDHLCEHETIRRSNSMIVCLPNKVIVKIEGKNKEYDFISG